MLIFLDRRTVGPGVGLGNRAKALTKSYASVPLILAMIRFEIRAGSCRTGHEADRDNQMSSFPDTCQQLDPIASI